METDVFWNINYDEDQRTIFFDTDFFSINTLKEAAIAIAEIQEYAEPQSMFVDLSKAKIVLRADEVRSLPDYFEDTALDRRKIRTALLLPETGDVLSLRLLQNIYTKNGITIELFESRKEAFDWLQSW